MPKKLFYLTILLLACFEISAQKVVFDLNARVNFTQSGEYTKVDSFDASSGTRLDDTTVIRRYYHFISENTKDNLARTAYEINGLFSIKLSERVSLRTGLGFNYGTYSIGSSSNYSISDVIRIDTIYDKEDDPIIIGSQCDCYENSSSDVSAGNKIRLVNIDRSKVKETKTPKATVPPKLEAAKMAKPQNKMIEV